MNKEKQIDEIAKLICTYPQCIHYNIIGECVNAECQIVDIAENLYEKGYRKASEVAREFIEAVDSMMECITAMTGCSFAYVGKYAELKKKYTEGER